VGLLEIQVGKIRIYLYLQTNVCVSVCSVTATNMGGETDRICPEIFSIEESIPSTDPKDYLTVTQRYYTPRYYMDPDRTRREDFLVLCHSNKICVICLAPSHPVLKDNLKITKVNLDVSKNIDRKANKTSGKSKKGGQNLQNDSILAILETDERQFKVLAVIPGKLICVNRVVYEESCKIVSQHDSDGHIAIILPSKGHYHQTMDRLLTREQYCNKIRAENLNC